MGVSGLLPLLKSIQRPIEIKKYSGEVLAVDAYGWLHRGAFACAMELAQGQPTKKYVAYCMKRVRMLKHFGITPYMVFDGDNLPSKDDTESSRAKRRDEKMRAGMELLKAGKPSLAHKEFQKAVDVTPEMARYLIEELKEMDIPYVVAPYEADPQMVYLERQGLVSGIISEDSDLLVFGAKRLLTKLDDFGQCIEINRREFSACRGLSMTDWTDDQFRQMAIFRGCDYFDGIRDLGLKTAYRLLRKHKTPAKVIKQLQFEGKLRIPPDFLVQFLQAENTFLYQRVFCPVAKEQVCLTTPPSGVNIEEMPFIGAFVEAELARGIATGHLHPTTKEPIVIASSSPSRKRRASSGIPANHKPIQSYFQGDRRIPLGNMDPNCFVPDPQRAASEMANGQRPIVFPLPRPYIDSAAESSNAPRPYTNRQPSTESSLRIIRRRTEPLSNLLVDDGTSLGPTSRRQTVGPHISSSQHHPATGNASRPPKKARLCDDKISSSEPAKEKSKFFPGERNRAASSSANDYLMSDDSIEEAMLDLPDVDGWHRPQNKKQITVFEEISPNMTEDIPKDDDSNSTTLGKSMTTKATGSKTSETPLRSTISRFAFSQGPPTSSSASFNSTRNTYNRPTPASSIRSSATRSTPASSILSFGISSTAKSTPATPLMTPLQRLGARALTGAKQPETPTFACPKPSTKGKAGRRSLDALPVNPSFVPLPPVDLEEVEALHQPVGSEDMLVPEDENEDDGQENVGQDSDKRGSSSIDLSRFLFSHNPR